MRGRDYFRLAWLSLKAKKKTTIQTIVGLSFGLILLFPMLFVAIGFYGGFNAEINANPANRAMRVMYSEEKIESGQVFCYQEYEKEIDKISGIKNNLKFDYYYLNNKYMRYASYSLNGGERKSLIPPYYYSRRITNRYLGIQVIDEECAHKPFIDMDYVVSRKPLVAGKAFTKGKSKGEIMVSTKFLTDTKLKAEDVVGSTITLYNYVTRTGGTASIWEDTYNPATYFVEENMVTYFKDYRIVGVYDSNLYLNRSPRYYSRRFDLDDAVASRMISRDYFWISSASLGEGGEPIAPKRVIKQGQDGEYSNWFYYEDKPEVLSEKITNDGYTFLPMGLGTFSRANFYPTYTKTQIVEFYSFEFAKFGYDDIYNCYRLSVTGDPDNTLVYTFEDNIAPYGFFIYQSFFDRFLFLCLGFGVFGGVIFLATILNLINTLHYSVQSAKGFLGICRAQGLKKRGVVRLFFNQITIIFIIGYFFAITIGGAACIAIKILFDKSLKAQIVQDSAMVLTLRWWYIPISLLVLVILTTVLSIIISTLLVRKVNKTPVLEILSEENRM